MTSTGSVATSGTRTPASISSPAPQTSALTTKRLRTSALVRYSSASASARPGRLVWAADSVSGRIAEALWRVAGSRGLDGVGLREIAAEAGVSLGQLQHYFAGKDELLLFALDRIGRLAATRVEQRMRSLDGPATPLDVVRATVHELLPLTEQSRTGVLVHVAFLSRAVHDDALRELTRDGVRPLEALLAGQIRLGIARGDVAGDRDPECEAAILVGLAEGLANYTLLDVHTPARTAEVMDRHLATLFSGAAVSP